MMRTFLHTEPVIAVIIVSLLSLRAAIELGMMSAHGSDAQMPIWLVFVGAALALWAVAAYICVRLTAFVKGRWSTLLKYALIFCWAIAISISSWKYFVGWRALADAANPETSPDYLRQLAHFDGIQAGYELDNRIASNPNSPVDVLRLLAKKDQLGTKMCLARNPRSPNDVLQDLSYEEDEWIQMSLHDNPNYSLKGH